MKWLQRPATPAMRSPGRVIGEAFVGYNAASLCPKDASANHGRLWLSAAFRRVFGATPAIGHEREWRVIAGARRMLHAFRFLPELALDRRKARLAFRPNVHERERDTLCQRQGLPIDLGPADHGDFIDAASQ